MTYLENQSLEMFTTWIGYNSVPMLILGRQGEIKWCNQAFESLVGYSNWEIVNKVCWSRISVNDEHLEADKAMINQCLAGDRISYTIKKQLVPKNSKPIWTDVHVCRFPTQGEFNCFLVTIQELKNDTSAAFSMVVETINTFSQKFEEYHKGLSVMEDRIVVRVSDVARPQNETEQIFLSMGRLAFKHPKIAGVIFVTLICMILGNQAFEVIKNVKNLIGAG